MMLGPAAPADSHIKAVCGYPPFADHGLLGNGEAVVIVVGGEGRRGAVNSRRRGSGWQGWWDRGGDARGWCGILTYAQVGHIL